MVKSILKRIIVGVGVALCLMALKDGGLIGDVQAMTVQNATPLTFYSVGDSGNLTTFTVSSFEPSYLRTTLYGAQMGNSNLFSSYIFWGYGTQNLDISSPLDISFLFYGSSISQYETPYRVWVNDANGNQIACQTQSSIPITSSTSSNYTNFITPVSCSNIALTGTNYFRIYVGDNFTLRPNQWYGISKLSIYKHTSNQDVVNSIDNNTQAVEDVNDTLNDDTVDNNSTDSTISTMNSQLASNNSITQLLTLPITLFQSILNSVNGACSSFSLGSLYNHQLTLPCINLQDLLGSTLYGIIDILISGIFILSFRKKMVDIFNNMTSLKDRGNELE